VLFRSLATDLGNGQFRGTIPASECGDDPQFFVTVEGMTTGIITIPLNGEASPLDVRIGVLGIAISDNFETDLGWTVTNDASLEGGAWERGTPLGGGDRGDPLADSDGSGQAYLTDPADDNTDVDGGPTILTSPAFDLSGFLEAEISYDRYYGNDDASDTFAVEISDGGPWVTLEAVDPSNAASWTQRTFNVTDFVSLTETVQIRFAADDSPNDSILEAGVDAVSITGFICESVKMPCPGDCDGSNAVDFNDLVCILFEFGTVGSPATDCDGSTTVDFNEIGRAHV